MTQTSSSAVQTGNGVLTVAVPVAGGTLVQAMTTGVLTMGQTGTTSSTQSTNYLGARR